MLVSILDTWKRTTLIGSATSKPCQFTNTTNPSLLSFQFKHFYEQQKNKMNQFISPKKNITPRKTALIREGEREKKIKVFTLEK